MDNPETPATDVSQQDTHIADNPEAQAHAAEPVQTPDTAPAESLPEQAQDKVVEVVSAVHGFTKAELEYLEGRYASLIHFSNTVNDVRQALESYIANTVCKRLGVNPAENKVDYNISDKTLTVTPNPQTNEQPQNQEQTAPTNS